MAPAGSVRVKGDYVNAEYEGGAGDSVSYTAELTTNAASQAPDRATFDRLLATFRFVGRVGQVAQG